MLSVRTTLGISCEAHISDAEHEKDSSNTALRLLHALVRQPRRRLGAAFPHSAKATVDAFVGERRRFENEMLPFEPSLTALSGPDPIREQAGPNTMDDLLGGLVDLEGAEIRKIPPERRSRFGLSCLPKIIGGET
jgi:hypothetical protein